MSADLIVRLLAGEAGIDDCAWRSADAAVHGRGTLADAAAAAVGRRVLLVVPGSAVLLTGADVPASQLSRARVAIPWALEDRLVADVEQLHFALGTQRADGTWPVAVVARADMDDWLARCRAVGLQPHSVRPEPLALPAPPDDGWLALTEPGYVVVRTADDAGFACEPEMLGLLAGALPAPTQIRSLGAGAVTWPVDLAPLVGAPEAVADPAAAFTWAGAGIELLQGPYSRRERAGRQWRRWRTPAALAGVLALIAGIQLAFDYAALGAREAALREELAAVFKATFPDVQQVSDPRAQMAARLRTLQGADAGDADFAGLLARVGAGIGDQDATLTALTWRGGALELEIAVDDLPVLDRVQRGLDEAGLETELRGAERDGERTTGRITVRESQS